MTALADLEGIIDASGAAPRIERMLPMGHEPPGEGVPIPSSGGLV